MVFRGPFSGKAKGKLNLVAFIVLAMADKNIRQVKKKFG